MDAKKLLKKHLDLLIGDQYLKKCQTIRSTKI